MMDWTDRHFRYLLRLISRETKLYTEMITTKALIHGDVPRLLDFHANEHPLALQLGGSDPQELIHCAKLAEDFGYDEINLNVGCPSDRVQSGTFGLCLMYTPDKVADAVHQLKQATQLPITVKTRLGVDELDHDEHLHHFMNLLELAGVDQVHLHARKGWLKGLSPKENREIPPLQYERVYQVKQAFPRLFIGINGGIKTLSEALSHLEHVDSVMIGRAIMDDPFVLAEADQRIFKTDHPPASREDILQAYLDYARTMHQHGTPLKSSLRYLLPFFQGRPGAKAWRTFLSEYLRISEPSIEHIWQQAQELFFKP